MKLTHIELPVAYVHLENSARHCDREYSRN
jgi:hypothetical protein